MRRRFDRHRRCKHPRSIERGYLTRNFYSATRFLFCETDITGALGKCPVYLAPDSCIAAVISGSPLCMAMPSPLIMSPLESSVSRRFYGSVSQLERSVRSSLCPRFVTENYASIVQPMRSVSIVIDREGWGFFARRQCFRAGGN